MMSFTKHDAVTEIVCILDLRRGDKDFECISITCQCHLVSAKMSSLTTMLFCNLGSLSPFIIHKGCTHWKINYKQSLLAHEVLLGIHSNSH